MAVTEVIKIRSGTEKTFNKQISDLHDNVTLTSDSRVTGILKYVNDLNVGEVKKGNFLALHIDNTKLSSENVKMGFEGNLLEPDKNDWNYTFTVDEERKAKKLQLEIEGKVEYSLDISELTLQTAKAVVPEKTVEMYGKRVEELTTDLTLSNVDGVNKVGGKLNYVTDFEGFSKGAEGTFFPFQLEGTGTKMTFKKNGRVSKKDITFEKNNVFKIAQKSDTWEVLVDDVSVAKFDFTNVELGTSEN